MGRWGFVGIFMLVLVDVCLVDGGSSKDEISDVRYFCFVFFE
jgi:hypothetical protein